MLGLKKDFHSNEIEKNGAQFYDFLKLENIKDLNLICDTIDFVKSKNAIYEFVHGMKLKSYSFEKYKTKNNKVLKLNLFSYKKSNKILLKILKL